MQITPELIEHTEFHTGLWLQNASQPGWYYFCSKKNPNIISKNSFIETVDRPLRNVVTFLHKNGIRTTPSCSGHFFSEKKIKNIYDLIALEAGHIRTKGIYLKDVQTDRLFSYRKKDYELPWTKTEFTERLMNYQTKGILGMHINSKIDTGLLLGSKIRNTKIYMRDNIVFFLCSNQNNNESWKQITEIVKKSVKS